MDSSQALEIISKLAWPITVALFGIIFSVPLYMLLQTLAGSFGRIKKIKIGSVDLSLSDVDQLIVERELLKIGIMIAAADGEWEPEE